MYFTMYSFVQMYLVLGSIGKMIILTVQFTYALTCKAYKTTITSAVDCFVLILNTNCLML